MVIIFTGLILTWTAYFSHSQKLTHENVIDNNLLMSEKSTNLSEIRGSYGFKKIAFFVAKVPFGLAEKMLLISGIIFVNIGFLFLLASTAPKKQNDIMAMTLGDNVSFGSSSKIQSSVGELGIINYLDKKSRECIIGLFIGTILLLSSFPILHIWSINSENNISGPMCVSLILSITGLFVVIIYIVRMPSIYENVINNKPYWLWMNIIMGFGLFMGTFSFLFGSISFIKYGDFRVGTTFLACSVVLFLAGFILGLVAYAKQRRHIWELETIIEKRTDILQRKRATKMAPAVRVVDFV